MRKHTYKINNEIVGEDTLTNSVLELARINNEIKESEKIIEMVNSIDTTEIVKQALKRVGL